MRELTIFYDSSCPLCVAEMTQLARYDHDERIAIVDLDDAAMSTEHPDVDPVAARDVLHGKLADGSLITGLDVTCLAWSLVDRHRWLKILRWPVIRNVADWCYLVFARHRYRISWLLTGRSRCDRCVE